MKRFTCIILVMLMMLAFVPTGIAANTAAQIDPTAKLKANIMSDSVVDLPVATPTKAVTVPEVTMMGLTANTGNDKWLRFPTTDLTDITILNESTQKFTCACYDGDGFIYAIAFTDNSLYRIPYDKERGIAGTPQKMYDFYTAEGVASAIAYKKNTNEVIVVYNATELFSSPVNSRSPKKLCDIYEGAIAIATSTAGTIFAINAYGIFGSLNSSTGKQSQLLNTGITVYDGSFYIQCASISGSYFYWNAVSATDGTATLCVIDISNKEGINLGYVLESPGIRFWGLFAIPEITITSPDGPDEFDVFYENWEFGTTQWNIVDNDGDSNSWSLASTAYNALFDDGRTILVSSSGTNTEGAVLTPDDWVISNAIVLPSDKVSYLTIWLTAMQTTAPQDNYAVYIATESPESLDSFTMIDEGELTHSSENFFELDLSAYKGQTIYIGIQHKNDGIEGQVGVALDVVGIGTAHCYNTATFVCGITGETISTATVRYGRRPQYPRAAEFEHYEFIGWDNEDKIYEDTTITSVYEPEEFSVIYYVDGELFSAQSVGYGTVIELIEPPTRPGHTFSGWSEVPETMPAENINVYGTFTAGTYTITFVDGITEEVISTLSLGYGETITYPTPPEHEGYTFIGWSESPETVTDNATITAQYSKGIPGDVNGDGKVNTGDATTVLRYSVGLITFTSEQLTLADYNGDGKVNTGDATAILRFTVGL